MGAALTLFRRQGISRTGVNEICRAAGVSKGVFAHHFPGGKATLVDACLDRNGAEFAGLLTRVAAQSDGTAPGLVRSLFARYADLMRRHGADVGCPIVAASVDMPPGAAGSESPASAAVARWREVATALHPGLAGHDEFVLASLQGALVLARATGDPGVLERAGERVASSLAPHQDT